MGPMREKIFVLTGKVGRNLDTSDSCRRDSLSMLAQHGNRASQAQAVRAGVHSRSTYQLNREIAATDIRARAQSLPLY